MNPDIIYEIGLTLIPAIGRVHAKNLVECLGNARSIFQASTAQLLRIEGLGEIRARSIKSFKDFRRAEEEIKFIEQNNIRPLFITDKAYPQRLLNCYDSPTLLYFKGNADLNASRIISVIGTRHHTDYGRQMTEKLINGLAEKNILVISGLAYGIDGIAHKAALQNNLATVGVLAHGMDQVYPPAHTGLAKNMITQGGGLITEFLSRVLPDKHNFPARNRIVAGMSDATIVVETGIKGGSMITAELANGYNRDVLAIPGRATDTKSEGSNYLIRNNKAGLLTNANELLELMGWEDNRKPVGRSQRQLFIELTPEEKWVVGILQEKEVAHIDEINIRSSLSSSAIAAAILSLELQNVIVSLPGKRYRLS